MLIANLITTDLCTGCTNRLINRHGSTVTDSTHRCIALTFVHSLALSRQRCYLVLLPATEVMLPIVTTAFETLSKGVVRGTMHEAVIIDHGSLRW